MKKKSMAVMVPAMVLLLTACGGETVETTETTNMEEVVGTISPQDDPNEGLGGDLTEDTVNDFSGYEGIWLGEANNEYDSIELDAEGNWTLYRGGEVVADGYLLYEPEWESIYAYNYQDGSGGRFAVEDDGRLYITTYGYFTYGDGMETIWYNDDGNEYYSWNADLYQRDVSEFAGVWYYDGDLAADTYIVIDGSGNWSYYQRASGDAEGTEMDYGIFTYSTDEASTYYADSTMYDGVSIRVFEFDTDELIWGDEGAYYRME